MINARAETVATKPAFREAFRKRRCLLLADGFYEWQQLKGRRQPYYIQMNDQRPFALAGLWEQWEGPEGRVIDSGTIITTEPNDLVAPLHNRMPAILDPSDYTTWLDPKTKQPEVLQRLLHTYPPDEMSAYPVTTRVNDPATDSPECVRPLL
jgi:putative SOS response-associated peptidase YedK